MASSGPPEFFNGGHPAQGAPQGGATSQPVGEERGPLSSLNIPFIKTLNDKRKARDGKTPKRRGPKPDSKPALTRRQELNRQAQRTHRERKELYIKSLEDEVLRLKESFTHVSQDRDKMADENNHLKALLRQNGIPYGDMGGSPASASQGYNTTGSASGTSYLQGSHSASTPPLTSQSIASSMSPNLQVPLSVNSIPSPKTSPAGQHFQSPPMQHPDTVHGIDPEQAGIDFVLTLEKPCMEHLSFLMDRAATEEGGPCGHALMATCPPEPVAQMSPTAPFGYTYTKGGMDCGQRTWELNKGDLTKLMDLSKKLDLDGEITPVMAWGMVMAHPQFSEFTPRDFARLAEELKGKVRCYGFGAVMEEFEVRDSLENVLSRRPDATVAMAC